MHHCSLERRLIIISSLLLLDGCHVPQAAGWGAFLEGLLKLFFFGDRGIINWHMNGNIPAENSSYNFARCCSSICLSVFFWFVCLLCKTLHGYIECTRFYFVIVTFLFPLKRWKHFPSFLWIWKDKVLCNANIAHTGSQAFPCSSLPGPLGPERSDDISEGTASCCPHWRDPLSSRVVAPSSDRLFLVLQSTQKTQWSTHCSHIRPGANRHATYSAHIGQTDWGWNTCMEAPPPSKELVQSCRADCQMLHFPRVQQVFIKATHPHDLFC